MIFDPVIINFDVFEKTYSGSPSRALGFVKGTRGYVKCLHSQRTKKLKLDRTALLPVWVNAMLGQFLLSYLVTCKANLKHRLDF
jgi:hypothetical protein